MRLRLDIRAARTVEATLFERICNYFYDSCSRELIEVMWITSLAWLLRSSSRGHSRTTMVSRLWLGGPISSVALEP